MTHPRIANDPRTISRVTGLPLSDVMAEQERERILEDRVTLAETLRELDRTGTLPAAFERRSTPDGEEPGRQRRWRDPARVTCWRCAGSGSDGYGGPCWLCRGSGEVAAR